MPTSDHTRHAWIDASAGIAGDMLLGALLDAGAPLAAVQDAVDAVLPGAVRITVEPVTRAGQRAAKAEIELHETDSPRRTWRVVRDLVESADLADPVRQRVLRVFEALASAEASVHGTEPEQVHFHEVGALDSIADVVGVCAALDELAVTRLSVSEVAVGSGRAGAAHGDLPVPVPAVLELSRGFAVRSGGVGELTTPTGMALLAALAAQQSLPLLVVEAVGIGAGSKDVTGRPNVTRVVLGREAGDGGVAGAFDPSGRGHRAVDEVVLEANVDDLDPRVWPAVLDALLAAGAADAWLTPILMKKGRPAHTLHVLAASERTGPLRQLVFELTTTLGVRESGVRKTALARTWRSVRTEDGQVRIKVAQDDDGRILTATPEFDDAASVAAAAGVPVGDVLTAASHAARAAGLVRGEVLADPGPAPAD